MRAQQVTRRSVVIAFCTFVIAMAGMFLFDGTTNESHALTTLDCRTCHVGTPIEGRDDPVVGNWGSMQQVHHSKGRGCGSCHIGAPVASDPTNVYYQCSTCHQPPGFHPPPYDTIPMNIGALSVTEAHAPLHDSTDVPDPATCAIECHSPEIIVEHDKYPIFDTPSGELDCDRCHKNTNTDPALGPINVQEQIILGSSSAVTPEIITCEKCHTTIGDTGHAEAHDNVLPNGGCDTVACHNSNVMLEHTNRGWSCGTCHDGETLTLDPLIVTGVVQSSAGPFNPSTTAFCTDCHGPDAGNHEALHDQGFFLMAPSAQDNCTQCHAANAGPNEANLVAEHVTNQGLGCGDCHDRSDHVFDAINKGRDPSNMPVYCIDCHTDDTFGQGLGHAPIRPEAEPWNRCGICHILTALGNDTSLHNTHTNAAQSIGQDCSACHVPEGTRPDCALCHSSDNWNNTGINLNIIGPGAEDHDFHISPTGPLYNNGNPFCEGCHVSGVPGAEPLPVPYSECSNCHNGATATDISYGSPVHTTHQSQANCSDCHSPAPTCLNCHPHNEFKGPNMAQHDLHTDTFGADCLDCHINGIPGSEPLPYPFNECSVCHNPVGNPDGIMGSDITYGSTIHTNSHIAGGEATGLSCNLCHDPANPPTCAECHAPGHPPVPAPFNGCSACHNGVPTPQTFNLTLGNIMFGEVGHNVHMLEADNQGYTCSICHVPQGSPTCAECHIPQHPSIPAPYNTCDQCHDTLNPGQATHIAHKAEATDAQGVVDCARCHVPAGSVPNCGECHTGDANHENAHVNVGVPSPGCTNCHSANVVNEHINNRPELGYTCSTCHDSTDQKVIDAINNNTGTVTCYDCHDQNNHHDANEAKTGNCVHCHADPRPELDPTAPSGDSLVCSQCHIGSNGFVQTISGNAPATPHNFNTNGSIQDFGACFDCHLPTPFHGKPSSTPQCWKIMKNSPYYDPSLAPGKDSFNLFARDLQYQNSFWGDTPYGEDYADRYCAPVERSDFWNPQISFNWQTITTLLSTNPMEYTIPVFGPGDGGSGGGSGGGGGGGSQNDSVNITRARYDSGDDELEVRAENSQGRDAQLTVMYDERSYDMNWDGDEWRIKIRTSSCNDSTIEVVSSAGGSDSSSVDNCSSSSWSWRR